MAVTPSSENKEEVALVAAETRDMLAAENSRLEARNLELSEDIRRLRSDEAYIEEIARQKHGLLKKNETVYAFKPRARKE